MTTLRRRIVLPLALLAAVTVIALAFLGRASWLESRALRASTENVRAATTLAFALVDAVHEEDALALALRADDDPALPARVAEAGVRVTRLSAEITTRGLGAPTRESWEEFLRTRAALARVRTEIFEAREAGDAKWLDIAFDKWTLMNDRSHALLRNFGAWHLRQLERTVDDLQWRRSWSLFAAIAAVALGFVAAAVFAVLLSRGVVRPIAEMAKAAEGTTEASPHSRVPGGERSDEIGVLARSLNGMTDRLMAANARLAEAVRARDEFLTVASHELKTPLTSLGLRLGQLSRLASREGDEPVSPEVLSRAIAVMERQVGTLGRLVATLLDVTRLTSGRLPLDRGPTLVSGVVRDVVEQLSGELAAAHCPVTIEGDVDTVVDADRVRVEQVILNLLSNAVKYAPGSPIVIRITRGAHEVTVDVEDSGPGIAPEDQDRVFSRFERAVSSEHVSGFGLGLYIGREIARAHGGDLTLTSQPGAGSRFTLRLPVEPAPGEVARTSARS